MPGLIVAEYASGTSALLLYVLLGFGIPHQRGAKLPALPRAFFHRFFSAEILEFGRCHSPVEVQHTGRALRPCRFVSGQRRRHRAVHSIAVIARRRRRIGVRRGRSSYLRLAEKLPVAYHEAAQKVSVDRQYRVVVLGDLFRRFPLPPVLAAGKCGAEAVNISHPYVRDVICYAVVLYLVYSYLELVALIAVIGRGSCIIVREAHIFYVAELWYSGGYRRRYRRRGGTYHRHRRSLRRKLYVLPLLAVQPYQHAVYIYGGAAKQGQNCRYGPKPSCFKALVLLAPVFHLMILTFQIYSAKHSIPANHILYQNDGVFIC